jgi:thiamine monophosphate synthase
MRKALPIVIVAVLLTATVVDVVAAGVKTVAVRRHFFLRNACRHQRSGAQRHEEFSD